MTEQYFGSFKRLDDLKGLHLQGANRNGYGAEFILGEGHPSNPTAIHKISSGEYRRLNPKRHVPPYRFIKKMPTDELAVLIEAMESVMEYLKE